jgi:hypothetical protein
MERAGPDAEVVDEPPAAGQQGRVLDALQRLSRPRDGFDLHLTLAPGDAL